MIYGNERLKTALMPYWLAITADGIARDMMADAIGWDTENLLYAACRVTDEELTWKLLEMAMDAFDFDLDLETVGDQVMGPVVAAVWGRKLGEGK